MSATKGKSKRKYKLRLYVTGQTANSVRAITNLKNILAKDFPGLYELDIVDVLKNPQLAEDEKILATPVLAKVLPLPIKRIIGDLSDKQRVLIGLDIF